MQTQTTETVPAGSDNERERILDALARWIVQRPGLEFGNYVGSDYREGLKAYRAELRSITKDLHQARTLLQAVRWRTGIDAAMLKDAFRSAYAGRLSWNGQRLDYCTGQYWPTEYRRAACAVLASALWHYARENLKGKIGDARPGDVLRDFFKREFGRSIQQRWFD